MTRTEGHPPIPLARCEAIREGMTEPLSTVSIGDGIIDAVELESGIIADFPGGAALNLAVGLARLGLASTLATRFGADRHGFLIARCLREEGVAILNPPNVDFTGVAFSRRKNGEPSYEFSPAMFRRHIIFSADVMKGIDEADAVAVNSFPFDDPRQVDRLVAALADTSGPVII